MKNIIFSIIFLFSFCLFGNAEPIDIVSSLKSTGNLVALKKSDIEIKKESLFIKINGVSADIEVNYTYFNKGKEEIIDLAFPIDYEVHGFDDRRDPLLIDIPRFSISVNGENTYPEHTIEKIYSCDDADGKSCRIKFENEYGLQGAFVKRWYVTKIQFPQNRETKVSVKYSVNAFAHHHIYSNSPIPRLENRKLRYDFSPAQYFGMGKADEIEIVIDAQKVDSIGGKIVKISPLVFKEKDKIYRYSGKNFDFRKNPSVSVEYDIKNSEMFDYFKKKRKGFNDMFDGFWGLGTKVEVSSSLKGYDARNMFDGDPSTAWCFKKRDKEEFVEISLDPMPVVGYISVMNGYLKNKAVYDANGKVTEFDVTTRCKNKGGCSSMCEEYATMLREDSKKNFKPDIPVWSDRIQKDPFGETNKTILDLEREGMPLPNDCWIKIIIKSTVKGEKSDDVCISEMFLM